MTFSYYYSFSFFNFSVVIILIRHNAFKNSSSSTLRRITAPLQLILLHSGIPGIAPSRSYLFTKGERLWAISCVCGTTWNAYKQTKDVRGILVVFWKYISSCIRVNSDYSYRICLFKMPREIITLQLGQCGNQSMQIIFEDLIRLPVRVGYKMRNCVTADV